jgi:Beta-propeller repeat
MAVNRHYPNIGPRVSILDGKGNVLTRLGRPDDPVGQEPGQFMSPHGIAVDSLGNIYVGEVVVASWPSAFPNKPRPAKLKSLQKLEKLPDPAGS